MICAYDGMNKKCISWETAKDAGPFHCPECFNEVILRKGNVKIHHFAHKPPVTCIYGSGESEEHYHIKKSLFECFSKQENCKKCEIERVLEGVRPDVSLYINNRPVAIEIQKSVITIDEIIRRTKRYTALGIAILWIIPGGYPSTSYHANTGKFVHRIKEWELFLHTLYFGRVYYWTIDNKVRPIHFDDLTLIKESAEWYEPGGELVGVGGYNYKAKRLKIVTPSEYEMKIDCDFKVIDRKVFRSKNWTVPDCKIYFDKCEKWW